MVKWDPTLGECSLQGGRCWVWKPSLRLESHFSHLLFHGSLASSLHFWSLTFLINDIRNLSISLPKCIRDPHLHRVSSMVFLYPCMECICIQEEVSPRRFLGCWKRVLPWTHIKIIEGNKQINKKYHHPGFVLQPSEMKISGAGVVLGSHFSVSPGLEGGHDHGWAVHWIHGSPWGHKESDRT